MEGGKEMAQSTGVEELVVQYYMARKDLLPILIAAAYGIQVEDCS